MDNQEIIISKNFGIYSAEDTHGNQITLYEVLQFVTEWMVNEGLPYSKVQEIQNRIDWLMCE